LAGQLLKDFEQDIAGLTLIPSDGGKFEVMVDGRLIYSKQRTGRHAEDGEIAAAVEQHRQRLLY
jgi:selenoprotein W-related protein